MNKRVVLLEKCPNDKITMENWFIDLFSDIEIKTDNQLYPNSIFFFKNDELVFEQNYKIGEFWVNYDKFSFFETKFNRNVLELSNLIKCKIEKYFKMNASRPFYSTTIRRFMVERHFRINASFINL